MTIHLSNITPKECHSPYVFWMKMAFNVINRLGTPIFFYIEMDIALMNVFKMPESSKVLFLRKPLKCRRYSCITGHFIQGEFIACSYALTNSSTVIF
jgi:hypothetical protein